MSRSYHITQQQLRFLSTFTHFSWSIHPPPEFQDEKSLCRINRQHGLILHNLSWWDLIRLGQPSSVSLKIPTQLTRHPPCLNPNPPCYSMGCIDLIKFGCKKKATLNKTSPENINVKFWSVFYFSWSRWWCYYGIAASGTCCPISVGRRRRRCELQEIETLCQYWNTEFLSKHEALGELNNFSKGYWCCQKLSTRFSWIISISLQTLW